MVIKSADMELLLNIKLQCSAGVYFCLLGKENGLGNSMSPAAEAFLPRVQGVLEICTCAPQQER